MIAVRWWLSVRIVVVQSLPAVLAFEVRNRSDGLLRTYTLHLAVYLPTAKL